MGISILFGLWKLISSAYVYIISFSALIALIIYFLFKKENKAKLYLEESEIVDLIFDNIIILAYSDGKMTKKEKEDISSVFKEIWDIDNADAMLEEKSKKIKEHNNRNALFISNADQLSKALDKNRKIAVLELFEGFIKQDGKVTDKEMELYAQFRSALKPVGFWGGLFKMFSNKCPNCKSTNTKLLQTVETDRWRGTKHVTEKLSKGYRTRVVSTTFVQLERTYRCDECTNSWVEVSKEEK